MSPGAAPDEADADRAAQALEAFARYGRVDELEQHWTALAGAQRSLFEAALRSALNRRRLRRTLVSALDDHHLADVVGVLAPEAAEQRPLLL